MGGWVGGGPDLQTFLYTWTTGFLENHSFGALDRGVFNATCRFSEIAMSLVASFASSMSLVLQIPCWPYMVQC